MIKDAHLSPCGTYRWTLTRKWDDRPTLLVCMFNPSTADANVDDPTISLLCHIASHNGYGGIVVVNGIPLRSPFPRDATAMVNWQDRSDWSARDRLQDNIAAIKTEASKAGAVLVAWGALADRCPSWFEFVLEEIDEACFRGVHRDPVPIYCLAKTKAGHPKHPLARGKHKVPKTAKLTNWVQT